MNSHKDRQQIIRKKLTDSLNKAKQQSTHRRYEVSIRAKERARVLRKVLELVG